jgi:hypothetical protein
LTEAQDSLGLEEEMAPLYEQISRISNSKESLQAKLNDLKDTKSDIAAAVDSAEEKIEVWEKLQEDENDGKTVYRPQPESKKRKLKAKTTPRKKSKYTEVDSDDDDFIDDGSNASDAGSDYDEPSPQDPGEPLTEEEISAKIAELRATKKEGKNRRRETDDQIKAVREEVKNLNAEREEIDAKLSALCISGRNEYSRGAIQKDFAAGIKELDQELAEEEDAANFNPEVDARDYDEVARSLPVSCVSSRAYQKLKNRLQKDKAVPGFKDVEETEIPKLQAHCRKLTEAGREAACKRFLTNLTQLLNSLRLWSSNDGSGRNLTSAQLKREARVLDDKLDRLDTVSDPFSLVSLVPWCSFAYLTSRPSKKLSSQPSTPSAMKSKILSTTRSPMPSPARNLRPATLLVVGGRQSTVRIDRKAVSSGQRIKLWYDATDALQMLRAVIISMSS